MNIITGEKIQFLCDHFIGTHNDFNYNPRVAEMRNKHVDILSLNNSFNNNKNIFCYTHLLQNIDLLIEKLSLLLNDFIIIFHNSDHNFQSHHLKLFDSLPKLKRIYTQNMNVIHENVIALPIGIANSMWPHGDLSLFNSIIQKNSNKNNFIFFNFNVNTNRDRRSECYNKIIEKNIPFISTRDQPTYLNTLSTYKYAICPEGNGIDCHRFWECLYLKVIPICKKNILVEYFSKILPIVLLDDWSDLDIEQLKNDYHNYNWSNYKMLAFEHYEEIINNDLAPPI